MEECSVKVLSAIIDFMYGKSLEKKNFNWKEATTLFAMADLYCMDDLKEVTFLIIEPLLSLGNIMETAELAVKHNCEKLKLSYGFICQKVY